MRLNRLFGILVLAVSACGACAETPAATSAVGGDYSLSAVKVASLAPTTIMYQSLSMSVEDASTAKGISDFMESNVHRMFQKLEAVHVTPTGGAIFIYPHGQKAGVPVEVEIGIPVAEKTAALEGYEVRVLESTPTASAVFRGPYESLGRAFPAFFRELQQSGKIPAGELRERSLLYDGETSGNNVLLIEMQVSE